MPIEQRVMNAPTRPVPARPSGINTQKIAPTPAEEEVKPKKKIKLVIIIVVALAVVGAAAWFFLLRGPSEPAAEPPPVPGETLTIEAMSINLADGHYLRLGFGVLLTADAGVESPIDAAPARDAAITLFSGRTVAEIADPPTREALKGELADTLKTAYHDEVIDVFLTDYVTQ